MLARALSLPSNLMILDEPTNDLDLETLDLLEELLAAYEGTVLLVSHDRDFLDRVVTSVLVWQEEGEWTEYAGGYSQAAAQLEKQRQQKAQPSEKKIKRAANNEPPQGEKATKRLSYKDKYALETLPDKIADVESKIAAHQKELEDPDLFTKDPERFNQLSATLTQAMAEHSALEEQWLELEMKREELEGG